MSSPKPIASRDAALIAPQIRAALNGTLGDGTSHPFLQKIEKGQAIRWQAMSYYRIHKATLMKDINRLVSIGVIKK